MEKDILKQYDSIKKEIEETNRRIQSAIDKLMKLDEEGCVKDTVSGGEGGRKHYMVEGYPTREYSMLKTLLHSRQTRLENLKIELLKRQQSVEEYISTMTDSDARRVASFRYIDNLSWKKTAEHMGAGYTSDACRKILERYSQKKIKKK